MTTDTETIDKSSASADEIAFEHPKVQFISFGDVTILIGSEGIPSHYIEVDINNTPKYVDAEILAQDIANYSESYPQGTLEMLKENLDGVIDYIEMQEEPSEIPNFIMECCDAVDLGFSSFSGADDVDKGEEEDEDDETKGLREELKCITTVTKDKSGETHTFYLNAILLENEEIFIEYTEDGKTYKVTEEEALSLASDVMDSEDMEEMEDEVNSIKRKWDIMSAWPNGGKTAIDANSFTPPAATSNNLYTNRGLIDRNRTAEYLMERINFAKIQTGVSSEGEEPIIKLYYYKDGIYRAGTTNLIAEILESLFPSDCTTALVNEIAGENGKIARRCKLVKNNHNLDSEGWKCLNNCIIKLPTKMNPKVRVAPQTPFKYFTKKLNVTYDGKATCPDIEAFFEQVSTDSDMKQGLIEIITWLLTPGYDMQWVMFLVGEGANGKSVYLRLIAKLFGHGYTCGIPLVSIADEKDKFRRARLYGRLVNICEDIGHDTIRSSAELKNVSGGGLVFGEIKYGASFEFFNQAKLIFSTNRPPIINDDTYGINRRVRSFAWTKQFMGKDADPDLFKKLSTTKNMSGLFNLAIKAFPMLIDRVEISGVREGIDILQLEADSGKVFLNTECEVWDSRYDAENTDYEVEKEALYNLYVNWCVTKKIATKLGRNKFYDEVMQWSKVNRHGIESKQVSHNGDREWYFVGLKCLYSIEQKRLTAYA